MKTRTKALLLVLSAIILVVATVFGTLAYLTATTEVVKNTFTVGKVAITLDEAIVDLYGEKQGDQRTDATLANQGNTYKLISGHTYTKDPTVTVAANSEASYVRMIVTINELEAMKDVFGTDATTGYFLPQNFVDGWDDTKWITKGVVEDGDSAEYEFWYYQTVDTTDGNPEILDALFDTFTVPEKATNEQLNKLANLEINVVAHAIQADGFEATNGKTAMENAWAAFDAE